MPFKNITVRFTNQAHGSRQLPSLLHWHAIEILVTHPHNLYRDSRFCLGKTWLPALHKITTLWTALPPGTPARSFLLIFSWRRSVVPLVLFFLLVLHCQPIKILTYFFLSIYPWRCRQLLSWRNVCKSRKNHVRKEICIKISHSVPSQTCGSSRLLEAELTS